jgi:hypothetical protein
MLEFNENDCAREGKPRFWVFQGRYAALVVVGAFLFLMLFKILSSAGVDFWPTVAVSLIPMGLMALWVTTCVNGKAPSYTLDWLLFGRFKLRCWMFRNGIIQRAPQFNIRVARPPHPSEYV